jgi:hypothetical protein
MPRTRLIVIVAASVAAISVAVFFAIRPPKPTEAEWKLILSAELTAGVASAAASACSINPRPLNEVVHERLRELRISDSDRDNLVKQFALGMEVVLPIPPVPSKEQCDKILQTTTKMYEAVGMSIPLADLEKIADRLK